MHWNYHSINTLRHNENKGCRGLFNPSFCHVCTFLNCYNVQNLGVSLLTFAKLQNTPI